jgi:putative nucleotidyltransferase with HDIG domain
MNANDRLQRIADIVHGRLKETYEKREDRERLDHLLLHADYRWQHTLRVSQYGKIIAEAEGANVELLLAASLLHDIAWFDTGIENSREHGRIGAGISQSILQQLDYPPQQIENICYAIASHVDVDNPDSLEAKILHDADNIDRFGPYRVLQWCYPDLGDYDALADKLRERITRLETYRDDNSLFTQTGKQLFTEQLNLQIEFFCQFVGEKDLSIMPNIESL